MENTPLANATFGDIAVKSYNRRSFLSNAGKGIIATGIMSSLGALGTAEAQVHNARDMANLKPVQLPPLDDASEQEKPPVPNPQPPDKRIGYALVGLGHLMHY